MKLKKFITLGLAAVMATSAIGINAIAADSDKLFILMLMRITILSISLKVI